MKIIALLPFKNEEWVIKEYIASIKKVTSHIIAYDDYSTDLSRKILEEAGAKIISEDYTTESGWAEHSIRQRLLIEGRKEGGTHFICLDADEIFSDNFYVSAIKNISTLEPGQSLWLDWVTLFRNKNTERVDGVYKNINKSFIFCDDVHSDFPYAFLGVSRSPGDPLFRKVITRKDGSVIHFQFLNTERSSVKRIWYMCSEHIKGARSAVRINATYEIQKDKQGIATQNLSAVESFTIVDESVADYHIHNDWRFKEILSWFEKYSIEYFEPLDIWDNITLKELFKEKTYRYPTPKIIPSWIIKINEFKNKLILTIRMVYSKGIR